ncbi:palmitoyl-protein thioesterase 1-like, partial [Mus pahari]|uniref:palmitoyl-protein thioesterase 1-like n=1 Tax=Mus pahari TaxID=10093 RepID=UPI000A30F175
MLLPCSLWLLSFCLLSWCCDARLLVAVDPKLESGRHPMSIWFAVDFYIIMASMKKYNEEPKSRTYVWTLETGKNTMKTVKSHVLDSCSQLCERLAQDPTVEHVYTIDAYFKGYELR